MAKFKVTNLGPEKTIPGKDGKPDSKTVDVQLSGEGTDPQQWYNVFLGQRDFPSQGDELEGELENDPRWGWKLKLAYSGGSRRSGGGAGFDQGLAVATAALKAAATIIAPAVKPEHKNDEIASWATELADELSVYLRRCSDKSMTQPQRGMLFKLLETKTAPSDQPDLEKEIRDADRVARLTKEKAGEYIDLLNKQPSKS